MKIEGSALDNPVTMRRDGNVAIITIDNPPVNALRHGVRKGIWEKRRDLVEWLDGGASFYVGGDMNAMAKDVRAALVRAFVDVKSLSPEAAEAAVASLEREKRYQQDV